MRASMAAHRHRKQHDNSEGADKPVAN